VLAGLQAGFTAGTRKEVSLPYVFASALKDGIATRGFIDPEAAVVLGITGQHACENDYILIGGNLTCEIFSPTDRKPLEERRCVDSGFDGFIVGLRFLLDGDPVDHVQTATKIGISPYGDNPLAAFYLVGVIIDPYELDNGPHTATLIFDLDFNRDGTVDLEVPHVAEFEVIQE